MRPSRKADILPASVWSWNQFRSDAGDDQLLQDIYTRNTLGRFRSDAMIWRRGMILGLSHIVPSIRSAVHSVIPKPFSCLLWIFEETIGNL